MCLFTDHDAFRKKSIAITTWSFSLTFFGSRSLIFYVNKVLFIQDNLIVACAHFTKVRTYREAVSKLEKFETWDIVARGGSRFGSLLLCLFSLSLPLICDGWIPLSVDNKRYFLLLFV